MSSWLPRMVREDEARIRIGAENVKKETPQKSKFKRLKMRLRLRHWQAVGLLESLWQCTALNAPDGDIGRLSNEDIAAELEWDDEPDELIGTLVACGWLDTDQQYRLIVHDWSDHVPTWLKGAYAKNGKQFADQVAKERAKQPAKQPAKQIAKQPQEHPTLADTPNLTIPNLTEPDPRIAPEKADVATGSDPDEPLPPAEETRAKHAYSASFERWYAGYPRKAAKHAASAAFGRAIARIAAARNATREDALDWLCEVTAMFAASPKGNDGEYVPYPATWLNDGRYDDDPSEWHKTGSRDRRQQPERVGPGQRCYE